MSDYRSDDSQDPFNDEFNDEFDGEFDSELNGEFNEEYQDDFSIPPTENDEKVFSWLQDAFGDDAQQIFDDFKSRGLIDESTHMPSPEEMKTMSEMFFNITRSAKDGISKLLVLNQARGLYAHLTSKAKTKPMSAKDVESITSSFTTANLWIDAWVTFDQYPTGSKALDRFEYLDQTIDEWLNLAEPITTRLHFLLKNLFEEKFGDIEGQGGVMFSMIDGDSESSSLSPAASAGDTIGSLLTFLISSQIGTLIAKTQDGILGGHDLHYPLLKTNLPALYYDNLTRLAADLTEDYGDIIQFSAIREALFARLFANVPWLKNYLRTLVNKYATSLEFDFSDSMNMFSGALVIDPRQMSGIDSMPLFELIENERQQESKAHLESIIALISGWVWVHLEHISKINMPNANNLREVFKKRGFELGASEWSFYRYIGISIRPETLNKSIAFWQQNLNFSTENSGDELWCNSANLLDKAGFTKDDPLKSNYDFDSDLQKLLDDNQSDKS